MVRPITLKAVHVRATNLTRGQLAITGEYDNGISARPAIIVFRPAAIARCTARYLYVRALPCDGGASYRIDRKQEPAIRRILPANSDQMLESREIH